VLWDAPQIIVSKRFPLAANTSLFEDVQSEFENPADYMTTFDAAGSHFAVFRKMGSRKTPDKKSLRTCQF